MTQEQFRCLHEGDLVQLRDRHGLLTDVVVPVLHVRPKSRAIVVQLPHCKTQSTIDNPARVEFPEER